jgi:hypothetical protein
VGEAGPEEEESDRGGLPFFQRLRIG